MEERDGFRGGNVNRFSVALHRIKSVVFKGNDEVEIITEANGREYRYRLSIFRFRTELTDKGLKIEGPGVYFVGFGDLNILEGGRVLYVSSTGVYFEGDDEQVGKLMKFLSNHEHVNVVTTDENPFGWGFVYAVSTGDDEFVFRHTPNPPGDLFTFNDRTFRFGRMGLNAIMYSDGSSVAFVSSFSGNKVFEYVENAVKREKSGKLKEYMNKEGYVHSLPESVVVLEEVLFNISFKDIINIKERTKGSRRVIDVDFTSPDTQREQIIHLRIIRGKEGSFGYLIEVKRGEDTALRIHGFMDSPQVLANPAYLFWNDPTIFLGKGWEIVPHVYVPESVITFTKRVKLVPLEEAVEAKGSFLYGESKELVKVLKMVRGKGEPKVGKITIEFPSIYAVSPLVRNTQFTLHTVPVPDPDALKKRRFDLVIHGRRHDDGKLVLSLDSAIFRGDFVLEDSGTRMVMGGVERDDKGPLLRIGGLDADFVFRSDDPEVLYRIQSAFLQERVMHEQRSGGRIEEAVIEEGDEYGL